MSPFFLIGKAQKNRLLPIDRRQLLNRGTTSFRFLLTKETLWVQSSTCGSPIPCRYNRRNLLQPNRLLCSVTGSVHCLEAIFSPLPLSSSQPQSTCGNILCKAFLYLLSSSLPFLYIKLVLAYHKEFMLSNHNYPLSFGKASHRHSIRPPLLQYPGSFLPIYPWGNAQTDTSC